MIICIKCEHYRPEDNGSRINHHCAATKYTSKDIIYGKKPDVTYLGFCEEENCNGECKKYKAKKRENQG